MIRFVAAFCLFLVSSLALAQQQVPNPINAPATIGGANHIYTSTTNRQQAADGGALPTAGQVVLSTGTGLSGLSPVNGNCLVGNSTPAWIVSPSCSHGALIAIQVFCASTGSNCTSTNCSSGCTYTPDSGTNTIEVILVGGGASGGGCAGAGTSQMAVGSGGNAGGILEFSLATGLTGNTVTVGTGGTSGTAGNNPGNNGTSTSFGASWVAAGGNRGNAISSSSSTQIAPVSAAVANTAAGPWVINTPAGNAGAGIQITNNWSVSGAGGSDLPFGLGGQPVAGTASSPSAGIAGAGNGGGGSGGACGDTSASSVSGGAGTDGIAIIIERT